MLPVIGRAFVFGTVYGPFVAYRDAASRVKTINGSAARSGDRLGYAAWVAVGVMPLLTPGNERNLSLPHARPPSRLSRDPTSCFARDARQPGSAHRHSVGSHAHTSALAREPVAPRSAPSVGEVPQHVLWKTRLPLAEGRNPYTAKKIAPLLRRRGVNQVLRLKGCEATDAAVRFTLRHER
jgi:hypothetical protein